MLTIKMRLIILPLLTFFKNYYYYKANHQQKIYIQAILKLDLTSLIFSQPK
jgi:hypothetical protein